MKLWLDDVRPPWKHGHIGWEWVKTSSEAIAHLKTGKVTEASLDHDLSEKATLGNWRGEKTGYDVVLFLEQNPQLWPKDGVKVHSMNPAGRERMQAVIDKYYKRSL